MNHPKPTFRSAQSDDWGIAVSLVRATQFDEGSRWRATLVPSAGEMSASFGRQTRMSRGHRASEPNAEKNFLDCVRRAKKRIRLYVVSNKLNCFLTLTFAEELADVSAVVHLTKNAFRRALYRLPPCPYIWVREAGSKEGRLHVHALVNSTVADRVVSSWEFGIAHVEPYPLDAESLRTASSYLSKDLDSSLINHGQSYYRGKGFTPEFQRLTACLDQAALIRHASEAMGSPPMTIQESSRYPAITALWDV